MNTKIKLPNGLEIECAEGAIRLLDLLVNLKQQGFIECNNVEVDNSKYIELETSYNELATKYSKLVEKHEELENQMLGNMQNTDVSEDIEKLTTQLELVLKENEELKGKLVEKENIIKNNDKSIYELEDSLTIKDNEIAKLNNAIELLKTQTVEPQITGLEEKKVEVVEVIPQKVENKTTDFDPNNPKDLEWLKASLNANPAQQVEEVKPVTTSMPSFELPKIQTPQPIQNGEFVDGYLVERNSNGDIIKADGLELMPNERTSIKFGIATVKKVVENRRLIEHGKNQENIATGWGE
ncbi:MAG: hypothetical protein ACRCXT_09770 [Paraclostridium sp.]